MALDLADHFFAALPELRYHPTAKRIRAFQSGAAVVDSTRAWIVWEPRRIVPVYAVPPDDINGALVESTEEVAAEERAVQLGDRHPVLDPRSGFAAHTTPGRAFDITTATSTLTGAAFVPSDPDLAGYAALDFEAFDEWREEDGL